MLKHSIALIGLLFISNLFCEMKSNGEIETQLLTLKGSSNGKYCLFVKGKSPIKIIVKKKRGIDINANGWKQIKAGFAKDLNFTDISFRLTDAWGFSGLRVRQSDDEESFLNGNLLLTISGIQENAVLFRREKKAFHILTFRHCYFRIRVLVEEEIKKEAIFILEYKPETEELILYRHEIEFPNDIILN